jgi:PEP-CTERM motif
MTKIRFIVCALFLICTVALIPQPASAGVVFTTLGPSNEFDATDGYYVDGSDYTNQVIGSPFTLGAGTTVADAVLALGNYLGNNNPVNVYIESDASGLPGGIIATLSQVGTIPPFGSGSGLVTFTCSGAECTLTAGSYWLVAQEPDASTQQAWDFAYQDATSTLAYNHSGSSTGPWGADVYSGVGFRIDDTGVPEPTSILLIATGLLGIGIARRRSIGRG